MKKKMVKIEILKSKDGIRFEVFMDGNRVDEATEWKIIEIIGIGYLIHKIK